MNETYTACVIDSNDFFVEFVLVDKLDDGTEKIQFYKLKNGESLVNANAPIRKMFANCGGFVKPKWNDAEWVEGATAEEIAEFDENHPAPVIPNNPTEAEQMRADIDFLLAMGGVL